jgi:hypothetical protein
MPKAVLLVQSQAVTPDREDEYHKWYDQTHLPQVCEIPGITGARRYTLSSGSIATADPSLPAHLAIYELDTDDIEGVLDELAARAGDGRIDMSDVLQLDPLPNILLYVER